MTTQIDPRHREIYPALFDKEVVTAKVDNPYNPDDPLPIIDCYNIPDTHISNSVDQDSSQKPTTLPRKISFTVLNDLGLDFEIPKDNSVELDERARKLLACLKKIELVQNSWLIKDPKGTFRFRKKVTPNTSRENDTNIRDAREEFSRAYYGSKNKNPKSSSLENYFDFVDSWQGFMATYGIGKQPGLYKTKKDNRERYEKYLKQFVENR